VDVIADQRAIEYVEDKMGRHGIRHRPSPKGEGKEPACR
jgi:hypothetical protein